MASCLAPIDRAARAGIRKAKDRLDIRVRDMSETRFPSFAEARASIVITDSVTGFGTRDEIPTTLAFLVLPLPAKGSAPGKDGMLGSVS